MFWKVLRAHCYECFIEPLRPFISGENCAKLISIQILYCYYLFVRSKNAEENYRASPFCCLYTSILISAATHILNGPSFEPGDKNYH